MILTIVVFILILGVLVVVHEFGHFIASKKSGVLVEEFAIGFPPRIFSVKWGETRYSINALPIGGYVKVLGEEYDEAEARHITGNLKKRTFVYKAHWQKALIIIAGIVMNFLLGWVLISYLFTQGIPTPVDKVVIDKVQPQSPAAAVGIKENDIVVKVMKDGQTYPMKSASDLIDLTKKFADQDIVLEINSQNKVRDVTVRPRQNPPPGQGSLGIVITSFIEKKYPWYQAPFYGLVEAFRITQTILVELGKTVVKLATGQTAKVDVSGPIGIAQYTGQAIKFGQNAVLELMALLSLNLAVINILPFPALDGGRLAFVLYEWITGKRVNQKFERYMNMAGISILLGLTAVITFFDILKLIKH
jgi:regulator of sigma E protease